MSTAFSQQSGVVGKNQDATCYVGNLEERATDSLVWELFVQVAPVVSLHIPRDRVNQTHFGYGFIELQSEADADYAAKVLQGVKLFGKALKINRASADRRNLDVGANLFIGNLDLQVDEATLLETFKMFGNVISAKIAREGEGGLGASRGFGFVSFDGFEVADAAIEAMNGQFLCNRPITVSYAFKKDGKGERHGTAAERLLAAQARRTGLISSNASATAAPLVPSAMNPLAFSGYRPSTSMYYQNAPGMPMSLDQHPGAYSQQYYQAYPPQQQHPQHPPQYPPQYYSYPPPQPPQQ